MARLIGQTVAALFFLLVLFGLAVLTGGLAGVVVRAFQVVMGA